MEMFIKILFAVVYALIGGSFVSKSIKAFKKNEYFVFGLCLMLSIAEVWFMLDTLIN
jgi:hypothetical protein